MRLNRARYLGIALLLSACSTPTSGPQPTALTEFAPSATFVTRWQADLGAAGNYELQPAITSAAIVGVSNKGILTALDRATGKLLWQVDSGVMVSGGVGSDAHSLLVGSDKGEVLAYDLAGKALWKSRVSSEILSAPQVVDGVVIVRSGDSHITALDANDGKRLWSYERATPPLVVRNFASVTVQRGVVYAGFAAGKIVALNLKTGGMVWENSVSQPRGNTELDRISDITSNVVVDDEQACAIAFQGHVACFDAAQGSPLWNRDISSDKGMMLLRKYVYLSDDQGRVMALDKATGSTLWKSEQLLYRNTGKPLASGEFIVVGEYQNVLHGLSRDDGHFVARSKLDSTVIGAPLEFDGGLLVATREGKLYSLTLH